jgi:hypothetical protein
MLWTSVHACIPESMIPIAIAVGVELAIVFRDLYLITKA